MNLKYRYNELMYVNYSLFKKDMGLRCMRVIEQR